MIDTLGLLDPKLVKIVFEILASFSSEPETFKPSRQLSSFALAEIESVPGKMLNFSIEFHQHCLPQMIQSLTKVTDA